MNGPPPSVLAAISAVSETVLCFGCLDTIAVRYDPEKDEVQIRHPLADCEHVIHPDTHDALTLSFLVLEEIERKLVEQHVYRLRFFLEELPTHVGAGA